LEKRESTPNDNMILNNEVIEHFIQVLIDMGDWLLFSGKAQIGYGSCASFSFDGKSLRNIASYLMDII
tara:strand:+ start:180 stop:383 length:204 start_codon:yes stop_codon:yes gene_type:complete